MYKNKRQPSNFNDEFSGLLQEAKKYTPDHPYRKACLTRMIRVIENSCKLYYESTPYYEDALQQTWTFFCRNINKLCSCRQHDSELSSIILCLNNYLKWRLSDLHNEHRISITNCLKTKINIDYQQDDMTINLYSPSQILPILEKTIQWIKADPSKELRHVYIQNRPDVNCQKLLLKRLLYEQSWKNISEELNLSISTLGNFYQRECIPRLRKFEKSQDFFPCI